MFNLEDVAYETLPLEFDDPWYVLSDLLLLEDLGFPADKAEIPSVESSVFQTKVEPILPETRSIQHHPSFSPEPVQIIPVVASLKLQTTFSHPKSTFVPQDLNQDFDYFFSRSAAFYRRQNLPFDISRSLSAIKYSELFFQSGNQLLVDKHPQFSEQDLKQIEETGFIYFMKNVKVIVPKIGPWRFQSHVRSGTHTNDRSYNLLGFPIRCKVKEWVVGGDLWRMYHFIKGKTPKER